eukprot:Gregarina_sp_Poly_1__4601@NODE_2465_length_2088_cov_56_144978_g1560_i0_p1_GENE_NODE_2465_length_2088_cov_56_144978_g1560_i0NODE_2465_length_2088_cov_56_144978_g1560_i0_p1_ORF_typecomplete_len552_score90_16Pkinase/PF00069_25/7_6e13Pkinase/PF00069_25/0_38Pkinase_Tyr/PF07714_17/4_7e09Pkinase_Tyr/PF07714_17/1_7Pkinase_Tyr/PF07714_17/2_6e02Kdo/PF06293_14/1_1e05Kinaselike/PF14531_6/0_002Kinaselike/PF14531_6/13_NODE_2465_length_2088_cov_56_144978_g1560_i02681923
MNNLDFFDLTNLPLISVLRRHQNVLLLLVNAASYFKPKQGATQTPVVAKLFPCKQGKISRRSTIALLETIKDDDELERSDRAFHRELVLLTQLHSGPQKNRGVVRLLGWGIAENYLGYLMESVSGPTLSETLNGRCQTKGAYLWKVHPPAYLQLLYRLHWALQLSRIIFDVHSHNIVHRDIRVDHFTFRTPPSPMTFGEIVLTDLGHARLKKTHVDELEKFVCTAGTPKSHLDLMPSHPAVAMHGDAVHWHYLAEALVEEFYGSSDGDGDAPAFPGVCLHWPTQPPPRSPLPAMSVAPEVAFCDSAHTCPLKCQAELQRERATQKQRVSLAAVRVLHTPRPPSRSHGCRCPLCQCHESRCDVWSLGVLLGVIFQVFENDAPRLEDCQVCGARKKFSDLALDVWIGDVVGLIETLAMSKWTNKPGFDMFVLHEVEHNTLQASRAVSHNDFLRPKSSAITWGETASPSTQASTPPHKGNSHDQILLATRQSQWNDIGDLVRSKVLDVLYWATESNPADRVSLEHIKDTFEMLFDIVYEFHQELRLPNVYPSCH